MPVPSSSLTALVDDSDPVLGELAAFPAAPAGLLQCLAKVTDPRKRRGVRHPITGIVVLALAATLAGAQSFVAIGEWVVDTEEADLAALGMGHVLPCESTIRRYLQRLDPGVLDALIGAWMWLRTSHSEGRRIIALDGKSLRGARDAAGHMTHLLAALCQHTGTVLGAAKAMMTRTGLPASPMRLRSAAATRGVGPIAANAHRRPTVRPRAGTAGTARPARSPAVGMADCFTP